MSAKKEEERSTSSRVDGVSETAARLPFFRDVIYAALNDFLTICDLLRVSSTCTSALKVVDDARIMEHSACPTPL